MQPTHPIVSLALEALGQAGAPEDLLGATDPAELPGTFDAAAASDPTIGLRAGGNLVVRATNPVIYLMMSAPTLRDAFAGLRRFSFVLQQRQSRLDVSDALSWQGSTSGPYTDFTAMCLLGLCEWVLGRPVQPQRVTLRRPTPPDLEPYLAAFRQVPEFAAPTNTLALHAADWDAPSAHGDPHLYELHREFLERSQQHLREAAMVQRVREELAQRLGVRSIELRDVAKALGCSTRTLQRRLSDSDTRFVDVVDGVRKERVLLLMKATDASVEAIARLTGFSDHRSLHRAFLRWTGRTPGAWRSAQEG